MAVVSKDSFNTEEHLLDTLNDLDIGFVKISNDGIILSHNLTFNKIFSYDPEKNLIGTKTLDYWLKSEERNKFREILFKNGIVKKYITHAKKINGENFFLQLNIKLNKNSKGEIISSEGTFVDVSKRIENEKKIRESEEKLKILNDALEQRIEERTQKLKASGEHYRELYENAPNVYMSIGTDKIIRECNNTVVKLLGYTKEEVVNMNILDLYYNSKEGIDRAKVMFQRFLKGKRIQDEELQMKQKDGNPIWISLTVNSVKDQAGQVTESRSMIIDITERKKAEKKLKNSEEKWKALSETSPAHITLLDEEHKILFINRTVPDLSKEEVIGTSVYTFVPQEFHQITKNSLSSVWETGIPVTYSTNYITKEGDTRFFDVWVSPVFQSDRIAALVSHSMDVTVEKEKELKLKESEQILGERVKELTCLYELSKFVEISDISLEDIFYEVINLIHTAWQFTDITTARITYGSRLFALENFRETEWKLSAKTMINKIPFSIEVYYLEDKAFLNEESDLIQEIGVRLKSIIEEREIQIKLKESEERYRDFAQNIQGIAFQGYQDFSIAFFDGAIEKITGYTSEDFILGRIRWDQIIHPDDTPIVQKQVETFNSASTKTDSREYRIVRKNGELRWVLEKIQKKYDYEKKMDSVQGIIIDITQSKKTENELKELSKSKSELLKKLRENEKSLRLQSEIVINMAEGVYLTRVEDNTIVYANPAFEEMYGYNPGEIIGKNASIVNAPTEKIPEELKEKIIGTLVDTGEGHREIENIKKNGSHFWCSANVSLFDHPEYGKIFVSIHTDISERKKAEDELRLHSQIMTNMYDAVNLVRENDGIIVYTNPQFEEIFGYNPGELIDKHISILNAPTSISPEEIVEKVMRILKEEGSWQGEVKNIKKDGTLFWCHVKVTSFKHPEYGKVWVAVQTDITARKKNEKEIFDLAQFPSEDPYPILRVNRNRVIYVNDAGKNLLHIVDYSQIPDLFKEIVNETFESNQISEFEAEFDNRAYSFTITPVKGADYINIYGMDITERTHIEEKLREVNKLKSEFLRRASHELKTPLISIKGFTELILSLYADQLDSPIISKLKEINEGCERLQNIINNLLKTSRLESPDIIPSKQKEDLSFLIKFCVHELESLAEVRNQSIELDIQSEIYAYIEKEEIHDVLSNLLSNAIKYTPPNGKIEIKTELKENSVVVSVNDNGIGFNEAQKKIIFQQFGKIERYGQGLDLGIDGTGLGLYISKRIVESHGGKIWMESEGKDKGASFYFTLPIAK